MRINEPISQTNKKLIVKITLINNNITSTRLQLF